MKTGDLRGLGTEQVLHSFVCLSICVHVLWMITRHFPPFLPFVLRSGCMFGSWQSHLSIKTCWWLISGGDHLQRHFLGLAVPFILSVDHAALEARTSLEASTTRMNDGMGGDYGALLWSAAMDEAFCILTNMFLSHLRRLIFFPSLLGHLSSSDSLVYIVSNNGHFGWRWDRLPTLSPKSSRPQGPVHFLQKSKWWMRPIRWSTPGRPFANWGNVAHNNAKGWRTTWFRWEGNPGDQSCVRRNDDDEK